GGGEGGVGGGEGEKVGAEVGGGEPGKRLAELRDPLVHVQEAEAADERGAPDAGGRLDPPVRPARVWDAPDAAVVPRLARALGDVGRMHDQAGGVVEVDTGKRETLRLGP